MNLKETNCPNCGAPIEHRYNHKCLYCGTFFDYRVERTEEINPRYMRDVKLIEIERCIDRHALRLIFEGTYLKVAEALEYGRNNTVFRVDVEALTPKRVFYSIMVDMIDFQRHDIENIFKYLPFELDMEASREVLWKMWGYKL